MVVPIQTKKLESTCAPRAHAHLPTPAAVMQACSTGCSVSFQVPTHGRSRIGTSAHAVGCLLVSRLGFCALSSCFLFPGFLQENCLHPLLAQLRAMASLRPAEREQHTDHSFCSDGACVPWDVLAQSAVDAFKDFTAADAGAAGEGGAATAADTEPAQATPAPAPEPQAPSTPPPTPSEPVRTGRTGSRLVAGHAQPAPGVHACLPCMRPPFPPLNHCACAGSGARARPPPSPPFLYAADALPYCALL